MPHASSQVSQGVVAACSAAPLVLVLLAVQLGAMSVCPLFWTFATSFIQFNFCDVIWDSMPVLCILG